MGDETLKPCPFCGGKAEFLPTDPPTEVSVGCFSSKCPLADVATEWNDRETAATYWNTRAEDRIRAEAAAERTAAILDMLDALASAEGDPCCASTLRRAHDFVSDAFPKPGSAEAPTIVTAPPSSAPVPPGGYKPEECPCCFSEETAEGADCFCPEWCPEQCEGGEVHRG